LADSNLKAARAAYAKAFGFEVTDKRVDRKVAEMLSVALTKGRKTVQLPLEIALALWLREGGAGRGVGALSATSWSSKNRILARVHEMKRKLQAQGFRSGVALEKAAHELSPGPDFPADAIIERIRHPSGKRKRTNEGASAMKHVDASRLPRNSAE
jgi:hypothetical protein